MAGKKKGVLTVSGEWAKHLRPDGRRAFWSTERKAAQKYAASEVNAELSAPTRTSRAKQPGSRVKRTPGLKP